MAATILVVARELVVRTPVPPGQTMQALSAYNTIPLSGLWSRIMPRTPKGYRLGHTPGRANRAVVGEREGLIIPQADPKWLPIARSWFNSLKVSRQTKLWEASDWMTAVVAAVALDRFLRTNNASIFDKFVKLNTSLGAMESDRRRAHIELLDPESGDRDEDAADDEVTTWHRRLKAVE